jgi:uncharacterized protein with GYD domain
MSKYLLTASYTTQGVQGLLKDGGTGRRDAVAKACSSVGATLESFYFAFGERDVFAVVDAPDNSTIAALALATSSSGLVNVKTTVLLTPGEVDGAAKIHPDYRAPGA